MTIAAGAFHSAGTTIALSNENADTTAAGSATFVTIGGVTDIPETSGEAKDIDVTTLASTEMEYLTGLADEGTLQITMNADGADTGQILLRTAKSDGIRHWLRITWPNGAVWTVKVLVKKYVQGGKVDDKVTANASFRTSGAWTYA